MSIQLLSNPSELRLLAKPHAMEPRLSAALPDLDPDESNIKAGIDQAVAAMRADLFCEEGIAGIAAGAFYSKFHFTREFTRLVGTTPRRFLAALRMQSASCILLTTDLSVSDASTMVGYSSVGTFSSRFSSLVGMSPRLWKECGGKPEPLASVQGDGPGRVRGHIELGPSADDAECDLFIAAFEDSIMQGSPVSSTRIHGPGAFVLDGLPEGDWTVAVLGRIAHPMTGAEENIEWLRSSARVTAYRESSTSHLPVRMRLRRSPTDPPVLLGGTHAEPAPWPKSRRNREYPLGMVIEER